MRSRRGPVLSRAAAVPPALSYRKVPRLVPRPVPSPRSPLAPPGRAARLVLRLALAVRLALLPLTSRQDTR
jgi:hypothetical protein